MAEILMTGRHVFFTIEMMNGDKGGFESVNLYTLDKFDTDTEDDQLALMPAKKGLRLFSIKNGCSVIKPLITINVCYPYSSFAALGSTIYQVGGSYYSDVECNALLRKHRGGEASISEDSLSLCYSFTTRVVCCDVLNNPVIWKECPSLNIGRQFLHLLVLHGRLYAVGGISELREDLPFMEMLDESTNSWVKIPNPPVDAVQLIRFLSAAIDHLGFILIVPDGDSPPSYRYVPGYGWELFEENLFEEDMILDYHSRPAVVVGNFLLWVDIHEGTSVLGYDLGSRRFFGFDFVEEGLIRGPFPCEASPQLVHMEGDELYVIYRDNCTYVYEGEDNDSNSEIACYGGYCCTRFLITASPDIRACKLKVISRMKAIGPGFPHQLRDAVAV